MSRYFTVEFADAPIVQTKARTSRAKPPSAAALAVAKKKQEHAGHFKRSASTAIDSAYDADADAAASATGISVAWGVQLALPTWTPTHLNNFVQARRHALLFVLSFFFFPYTTLAQWSRQCDTGQPA